MRAWIWTIPTLDLDDIWIFKLAAFPGATRLPELIAFAYLFVRLRSFRVPLEESGWQRGRGIARELAIGTLAGTLMWPLTLLHTSAAEVAGLVIDGSIVLFLAGTVIWTPIIEETLYRGLLLRHLRDRLQLVPAVAVSSVIFALAHPLGNMPYALFTGVIYALLRDWRGSLVAPIAAHATWNLLILASRLVV